MLLPANFDSTKPLAAARFFEAYDLTFQPGEPVKVAAIGEERKEDELDYETGLRLWLVGYTVYKKDALPTPAETPEQTAARLVAMEELGGGWYLLTTPWGQEGEKVQGLEAAEARRAELVAKGDTKGVTVTGGEGGWYQVSAPWLDEPVKVQGKDAAAVEEAMLIEDGPPAGYVRETPEEKAERLQAKADREAAQQRHAQEAADAEAAEHAQADREAEAARQQEAADAAAKEEEERQRAAGQGSNDSAGGVIVGATGGGWYSIAAPWLAEPEKVKGKAAADQRAEELRRDGPPPQGVEKVVTGAEGGESQPPVPAVDPLGSTAGSEEPVPQSDPAPPAAPVVSAGEGPTLEVPADPAPGTSEA